MSRVQKGHSREEKLDDYVATILSRTPKPLSIEELLGEIQQICTVGSSGQLAVRQAVGRLYQAVPVTPGQYGWLSHLLQGACVRHPLAKPEIKKGFLMLDELEHAVFFPEFFQTHRPQQRTLTIELLGGPTLPATAYIERKTWSLALGEPFVEWVNQAGGRYDDAIIISVLDAVKGVYRLRLQPHEARDDQEIEQRNIAFALTAESIVAEETPARGAMAVAELAARLIARNVFSDPTPPDDMHYVLHHFSVLELHDDGYRTQEASQTHERVGSRRRRDVDNSATDAATTLFGWQGGGPGADKLWDWLETTDDADDTFPGDDEACPAYQQYLDRFEENDQSEEEDAPLSHEEYHMLEAELEYMVTLEVEFGWLLPEQEERKDELAQRLMLDPDSLLGGDLDGSDLDDPPYWEN